MPGSDRALTLPARNQVRDPGAKLLGLLDFSASRGSEEQIEDTLAVLLFSLMGEFASPGAAALLDDGQGGLVVRAAKGRGASRIAGRRLEVDCSRLDCGARALTDFHHARELEGFARESGFDLMVPIRDKSKALGIVALSGRVNHAPWSEDEIDLVGAVGGIAGTVVANHHLLHELKTANRKLQRRVLDLHAIFDVSVELARACDPEAILRVFAQTAMAHLLVAQSVVLLAEGEGLRVAFSRGVTLADAERLQIEGALGEDSETDLLVRLERLLATTGIVRLVPFRAGSATRGFLGIGAKKNGKEVTREDLELLATLGHQAVTALDNLRFHLDRARREQLEREIRLAREIQGALFPRELPQLPGYALAALSEPCFEVGGDYYDALALDGGLLFGVADVAGKGFPAALLMSTLQATIRSVGRRPGEHPARILKDLNANLIESTRPGKFVTFFLASLDTRSHRLTWCNAGHNWPFLLRQDGTVERLKTGGPVLGVLPDASYDEGETAFEPGDVLFVFSDGVSEAMDAEDREYSEDRLGCLLRESRELAPEELNGRVLAAVRAHVGGIAASDDLTMLALARTSTARI